MNQRGFSMKQIRSLLSTALLASLTLSACSNLGGPTLNPSNTLAPGRVQAQGAAVQSDLSRYSIGAAKNLIAARQKATPVAPMAARNNAGFATPEWVKDAVF